MFNTRIFSFIIASYKKFMNSFVIWDISNFENSVCCLRFVPEIIILQYDQGIFHLKYLFIIPRNYCVFELKYCLKEVNLACHFSGSIFEDSNGLV